MLEKGNTSSTEKDCVRVRFHGESQACRVHFSCLRLSGEEGEHEFEVSEDSQSPSKDDRCTASGVTSAAGNASDEPADASGGSSSSSGCAAGMSTPTASSARSSGHHDAMTQGRGGRGGGFYDGNSGGWGSGWNGWGGDY